MVDRMADPPRGPDLIVGWVLVRFVGTVGTAGDRGGMSDFPGEDDPPLRMRPPDRSEEASRPEQAAWRSLGQMPYSITRPLTERLAFRC